MFTRAQLAEFNGSRSDGVIYLAIEGVVYDVSKAKNFYGPGGNYFSLSGKDATRPLATMDMSNFDPISRSQLNAQQIIKLDDWIKKFKDKYEVVGSLED